MFSTIHVVLIKKLCGLSSGVFRINILHEPVSMRIYVFLIAEGSGQECPHTCTLQHPLYRQKHHCFPPLETASTPHVDLHRVFGPGLLQWWLNVLSATELSMAFHLNGRLFGVYNIQKACLCLVKVLPRPLQPLEFVGTANHLTIRTATEGPAKPVYITKWS